MRYFLGTTFVTVLISTLSFAQRNADVGIRFNTNEYNRYQLEFRKPLKETAYWRLGVTLGFQNGYPYSRVISATDSLVTMREFSYWGKTYGLRFGLEKQIRYPWLSFHADLGCNYFTTTSRNWSYFHALDSNGVWLITNQYPGAVADSSNMAIATDSWLGGEMSVGLSFNFPVTENFTINFTGNYTGMLRGAVGHRETNDIYDEFNSQGATIFELYMSAGIGFRYVFTPATQAEVPSN